MHTVELERTFLAKRIPDLTGCRKKEIIDIYIPKTAVHPVIRIRKNGNTFEITKKEPVDGDCSKQTEKTIPLTPEEFEALSRIDGKKLHKIRHLLDWNNRTAEVDVYQDPLAGLVLVDFEFRTEEERDRFVPPDFCLADITQEEQVAGGMLCGKSYEDIAPWLEKFGYKKL